MKMTLSPRRRYRGVLLALPLIGSLAAGCGKPQGTVSGQVTYQGKPLTGGFVTFTPEKGPAIDSKIDSEGKYRVENVPVGTAKISVRAKTGIENLEAPKDPLKPREMMKQMRPHSRGPNIPPKYNDAEKSGLTCIVKQGDQEHNIELK